MPARAASTWSWRRTSLTKCPYQGYALLRSILKGGSDTEIVKAVDYPNIPNTEEDRRELQAAAQAVGQQLLVLKPTVVKAIRYPSPTKRSSREYEKRAKTNFVA
jgi:hypothetical protein